MEFTILPVFAPKLNVFARFWSAWLSLSTSCELPHSNWITTFEDRLYPVPVSLRRFTCNSLKPSVDAPPRSPTDDTEFSAQHARRVIGSGVVHERKASISAGPVPELKNKVPSYMRNVCEFILHIVLKYCLPFSGMKARIPLSGVFGLGCREVAILSQEMELLVLRKLVFSIGVFFATVSIFGGRRCGDNIGGSDIGACSQAKGGARSFEAETRHGETGHGLHRNPHHVEGGKENVYSGCLQFFVHEAMGKMSPEF